MSVDGTDGSGVLLARYHLIGALVIDPCVLAVRATKKGATCAHTRANRRKRVGCSFREIASRTGRRSSPIVMNSLAREVAACDFFFVHFEYSVFFITNSNYHPYSTSFDNTE